jgi:transglutaminase-like putative cysteine protease
VSEVPVNRNPPLDRHTFSWCAAAVVAALLPLAQTLPGWLIGLLAALAAIGVAYGWRSQQLHTAIRLPLTLAVAAAVLFAYGFRFGRDTGAALLVTMLALKLLETRRVRDARSVLSFALFAVMAGFLQDQAPLTLVMALAATMLALSALARVAEVESPAAAPKIPTRTRLWAVSRLLAVSLPLAAVGFFLFPRLGQPLWGLPENAAQSRTGLSDEMAPGDIAELYVDDTPVLRVLFDGPTPRQNEMYWRGPVLLHFDGRAWTRDSYSANLDPATLQPLGPPVTYTVTQEPTDRRYFMTLDVPEAAPERARMGYDRMAYTRRPQTELTTYTATSYTRYLLEPELTQTFRRRSIALPTGYNPRTKALIEQWVAEGAQGDELASRALTLFNREFTYTLSPVLLGRNSVDEFLFDTKQGYCEHFSSAFVVMMRFAGIPARVVTGYQGGRSNGIGNYWVVRQSDAHAWAEIWLEGRGWVRVDPTSAVAPERIERGTDSLAGPQSMWSRLTRPMFDAGDWLRRGWNEVVLGFNAARQRNLLQRIGVNSEETSQVGIALAIAIAAALGLTLWLLLRGPRESRDALGIAYTRFAARLAKAGVAKAPHEGPLDYAARVAQQLPQAAETVLALSHRYALRRYARCDSDPREDAALCVELRHFRVPG